jgi:glycosyltransferase involved in cell wall biosynthesis
MRLCLNMIVRNEDARIERALKSALPYITSIAVVDTGSTDNTKAAIREFAGDHGIMHLIEDAPFEDWSQARNAALECARKMYNVDYFLLMDADMELVVRDKDAFLADHDGPSYDMTQIAGTNHYHNRRLVHAKVKGGYVGRTHEYIDVPTAGLIDESIAYFKDHADGANRPGKFERDIRFLLADLEDDPKNGRAMFYLANSYRDAGEWAKAAEWYKKRVEIGGWDEEVWNAKFCYAHCQKDLGNIDGFVNGLLETYDSRKSRAEPLYDLAKYYRESGRNELAMMVAEAGVDIPLSKDSLFVNNYVYDVGFKEEISIAAFYMPNKKRLGYKTCSDLCMNKGPNDWVKHHARGNIIHYLEPLSTFCPSFKWKRIPFDPPDGWTAMNPSVTVHDGDPLVNVRCVNYQIDDAGRYLIKGTDGTANGENPINTRNFILSKKLTGYWGIPREVVAPADMPCEWPLVLGFEDIRLISWGGSLWSSSTVRQLCGDGTCEQVLTRLCYSPHLGDCWRHADMKRMLRKPRQTEKNWAPLVMESGIHFMYRPGEVVNNDGAIVFKHDLGIATDNISGSSQLIPFNGGWLAITHEAAYLPGRAVRYYTHRFVWYDDKFKAAKFSLPFFFHGKHIEFVAGMCHEPNTSNLLISYGYKDEEARIATVNSNEVEKFLWV